MLEFLKNLFGFGASSPEYGMGALPSPEDSRNIPIGQVQASIAIPDIYITDISMLGVNDQGSSPSCVGQSVSKIAEYYVYKKTGKVVKFDPYRLYAQCKLEDGIPDVGGTYASVAAKIIVRDGIDKEGVDSNDKVATGYAFIPNDFLSVCNAIYQNGMVTIGFSIDRNWFLGIIGKALSFIGGHQVSLHGYSKLGGKIYGLNSWGIGWIGKIAGYLDSKVKQGFFVGYFADLSPAVLNIIAILPIPAEILDDVKNTAYKFTQNMHFGDSGFEVKKLQERLGIVPADGKFGTYTRKKVMEFQTNRFLPADGSIGPKTLFELNRTQTRLDLWCEAIKEHEGWYVGSRSYRNLNPGNIKYVGQRRAVGKDAGGFCIFASYADGYQELKDLLYRAASGVSTTYRPEMNLLSFFRKYAPASDNNNPDAYAERVAKKIGVGVETPIKDLIV